MTLPQLPPVPHVALPSRFVIPLEALATFWAIANIILGFLYLLYGLRIFRVMTTITAALWGGAIGVMLAYLIDSTMVAMVFGAAALGIATWFYTRWMVAIPIGLGMAAIAWMTAKLNGANPLACFFIALAAAIAIGGPVLIFYRAVVMAITCLEGAALIIIGTATGILLYRQKPLSLLQDDLQNSGHMILAGVCMLLLSIPAFYFQRLRYAGVEIEDVAGYIGGDSAKESSKKKAA